MTEGVSLQQVWRWLVEEGEIERSVFERMRPPQVPEQPVPILAEEELAALLDVCKGNTFENRRDTAIIRLFLDTDTRCGDLAGLALSDLDFEQDLTLVMSKGRRRGRVAPAPLPTHLRHRWLAAGNQEQDLMRLTGWRSRERVGRYATSAAEQRAREAHRRAALGDRL